MLNKLNALESRVGGTPVVRLDHEALDLYAKLEFTNWTGSIKIRPAFGIIKAAVAAREINGDTTVIESTSGNFGVALAHLCRELGLRFTAVIDPNITPLYESVLRELGAEVVKVTERDATGGYLRTRLAVVAHRLRATPNAFWPNQYANEGNFRSHFDGTGAEICAQCASLDYVFVGVSSAGTIAGVSRRLKKRWPGVAVVAVDAEGSVIFGAEPKPRRIPGIGSSIVPGLLARAVIDDMIWISDDEVIRGCRELRKRHGIYAGGSSGACFTAIGKFFSGTKLARRPSVLFLCPDGGEAYADLIYGCEERRADEVAGMARSDGRCGLDVSQRED